MRKVVSFFDYTYFRIYKFFEGKGDNIPDTKGSMILSLIQFFILLDILVIVRIGLDFTPPEKVFILPVIVIIGLINWYKYEKGNVIDEFEAKWRNERKEQRINKGRLIVFIMIFSFLLPVIHGILEHNLKWI